MSPNDGMYPLSVANFNMIKSITRTDQRDERDKKCPWASKSLIYRNTRNNQPNISFCQDLYKVASRKREPYEIQAQKSNNPIYPKQKPYTPRQRYFILFMCKSSLNIVITASFYFFLNTKSDHQTKETITIPNIKAPWEHAYAMLIQRTGSRIFLCHAYKTNRIPDIWNLAPISATLHVETGIIEIQKISMHPKYRNKNRKIIKPEVI